MPPGRFSGLSTGTLQRNLANQTGVDRLRLRLQPQFEKFLNLDEQVGGRIDAAVTVKTKAVRRVL